MTRLHASPRVVLSALVVGVLFIVLAGIALGKVSTRPTSDTFWETLRVEGRDAERYATLAAMLKASDAVVVARVTGAAISRQVQGDSPGDVVTYGRIDLQVVKTISGVAPASVPLEFVLVASPEFAAAELQTLRDNLPTGTSVYFLHAKRGSGEQGFYRVTNSTGIWSATARDSVDMPLYEWSARISKLYAGELSGIDTMDEFVSLLSGYASQR